MDITETPHAEDFQMDLGDLISDYLSRGLLPGDIAQLTRAALEELKEEDDD